MDLLEDGSSSIEIACSGGPLQLTQRCHDAEDTAGCACPNTFMREPGDVFASPTLDGVFHSAQLLPRLVQIQCDQIFKSFRGPAGHVEELIQINQNGGRSIADRGFAIFNLWWGRGGDLPVAGL